MGNRIHPRKYEGIKQNRKRKNKVERLNYAKGSRPIEHKKRPKNSAIKNQSKKVE